jgi:hypothetical protein
MIGLQRIEVAGERFVLVEEAEYERLCAKASETVPLDDGDLPPLPKLRTIQSIRLAEFCGPAPIATNCSI